jgi:hypothetical protein
MAITGTEWISIRITTWQRVDGLEAGIVWCGNGEVTPCPSEARIKSNIWWEGDNI